MLRAAFLLLILTLSACGQSGDLYLPDGEPEKAGAAQPAASEPQKDEQKKETH